MMLMKKAVKDVNDDNAKHDDDSRMMPRKLMQKRTRAAKEFKTLYCKGFEGEYNQDSPNSPNNIQPCISRPNETCSCGQ